MGVQQRIPLRTLTERGVNGPINYQSGNQGAAPSVARPSLNGQPSSPVSAQLGTFLVAVDSDTAGPATINSGNGVVQIAGTDFQFVNIPQTQVSNTGPAPMGTPGNQTYPFVVPQNMIGVYHVWCCMECAPQASGSSVAALAVPWILGYAVDSTGVKYQGLTGGIPSAYTHLPSGATITQFRAKVGATSYSASALTYEFNIKIFGALYLTYPSANQ